MELGDKSSGRAAAACGLLEEQPKAHDEELSAATVATPGCEEPPRTLASGTGRVRREWMERSGSPHAAAGLVLLGEGMGAWMRLAGG